MKFIITIALTLIAIPAFAQTMYLDPSKNIFETYDPICNGSDPSIVFCDGFEDGTYIVIDDGGDSPQDDYWQTGVFWNDNFNPFRQDPKGTDYTECNSGTHNGDKADFGASGTPCTATMDWVQNSTHGRDAAHWLIANPSDPSRSRNVGTWDYYVRFYFKESGVTSTRCSNGWPNCTAFSQGPGNGYKAIEFNHNRETGGIEATVVGTINATGSQRVHFMSLSDCAGGFEANQNQGAIFDHRQHRDEWIFIELHSYEASNGTFELWMDACGRDGRSCTGTPTLRTRYTNINTKNSCGPANTGQKVRALWNNWWNTTMRGEIQIDEFVVRDGEVKREPIGFAPLFGSQPPPPDPNLPPPPVITN